MFLTLSSQWQPLILIIISHSPSRFQIVLFNWCATQWALYRCVQPDRWDELQLKHLFHLCRWSIFSHCGLKFRHRYIFIHEHTVIFKWRTSTLICEVVINWRLLTHQRVCAFYMRFSWNESFFLVRILSLKSDFIFFFFYCYGWQRVFNALRIFMICQGIRMRLNVDRH